MSRWFKILRNILFLFIFITFATYVFPGISEKISTIVRLSNDEISNFLALIDIILSTILALYTLVDQKLTERKCVYDFSIENDNLSLEAYRRFPSEIKNSYSYEYRRKDNDIETPYYGMEVRLEENALNSVGIPLLMSVFTGVSGEKITFSNLEVYIKRGEVVKFKKLSHGTIIEKPIQDGRKFLIRIQLLCNHELEKLLLDSRIYLSFKLTLDDDRGCRYTKYYFLKIQNIMGETRILSIVSRNNWCSYIGKLIKLRYQLYKK